MDNEKLRTLTPRQLSVYRVWWEIAQEGGVPGPASISPRTNISTGGVSKTIQNLASKELIPRRPASSSNYMDPAWRGMAAAALEALTPPPEGERVPVGVVGPTLTQRLLTRLQKRKDQTVRELDLADEMDVSPRRLREALTELRDNGYNVFSDETHVGLTRDDEGVAPKTVIPMGKENHIRFGVLGDTHLGSKFERLDVLDALYEWYATEGITTVYHTGNMIEGCSSFNLRERHKHGLDEQVDYFVERYPQKKGITTCYVTGDDHEGWHQRDAGLSVGRYIQTRAKQAGREDLKYLGFMEHDIEFANGAGSFMMRIAHPGGGSAYAISYTPQKIVESYSGGEKPAVLLIGHYHKMEYLPSVRGVRLLQTGCTVDQGVWARKKRLAYHLGGWILDLAQSPVTGACIGCKAEDRTFFDKNFYQEWER